MTFGGFRLQYRFPDSSDLADAAGAGTPEEGRAVLLARCLAEVKRQGVEVPVGDIPEEVIAALEEAMSADESGGEILIRLACPQL